MAADRRSITASVVRYSEAMRSSASPVERCGGGARQERRAVQRAAQLVLLQLVLVLEVALFLALLHLVERRLRDVDVALLEQHRHLAVEEREQQRADVRAVDVRVRHDDDAVVAQLLDVELVARCPRPAR